MNGRTVNSGRAAPHCRTIENLVSLRCVGGAASPEREETMRSALKDRIFSGVGRLLASLALLTVAPAGSAQTVYRAVQFQATGRSKTRPLRRSAANVIGQRKPKPHKPLQPIRPLDSRWLEPAAYGVEVA